MKLRVNGHTAGAYTGGKPFDAALPCVLMVHGAAGDHSGFNLLARWCAHHGYGVLAVDLPGHGGSEGMPLPSVEALADWVLALQAAAGATRASYIGHSLGSLIALEAAARAGEAAEALVMIGTAYPMKVSDALLATAAEQPERAMAMVNAWGIASLASKPGFPGPGMWLHGANLALMRRQQALGARRGTANVFLHDFEVCNRYAAGLEAAARVRCPSTLLLGRHDQMTLPKAAQQIGAALKAQVLMVDSGHHQLAEAPDATLAALRTALAARQQQTQPST